MNSEKRYCEYCGKCLCKIGHDRKNGRGSYNDWSSRKYHKKCYKSISEGRSFIYMCHDNGDDEKLKSELKRYTENLNKKAKRFEDERRLKSKK
jgi:hypothetical protein